MSRIPPHNQDSEQHVLGALLQREDLLFEIDVDLTPDCFYFPANQAIYTAILALSESNSPVDMITVCNQLRLAGDIDTVGGPAYVAQLTDCPAAGAMVKYHAKQVVDAAILRRLIVAGEQVVEQSYGPAIAADVLEFAERSFFEISVGGTKRAGEFESVKVLAPGVFAGVVEKSQTGDPITGVATGFADLDSKLAGLHPADLIILAGRPSMGKTALAMNIVTNVAVAEGKCVGVFSMEMSKGQLVQRMITSMAHVDASSVRKGYVRTEDWPRLQAAAEKVAGLDIHIDDSPALTPMQIRSKARKLMVRHPGLSLIVIDYMQLMRDKAESREREISQISGALKALAKELDIPVLALSQLNRSLEARPNKRPMMSDLRDSGSIEQDADVIMFIYRDEVYNKAHDNPRMGIAEIEISKQRKGPTGIVEMAWLDKITTFADLAMQ